MIANNISACITTNKIDQTREFYTKYFDAKITFDCGWYLNLRFEKETSELQFMTPQDAEAPICNTAGLTYNFMVENVDKECERLVAAGLTPILPLEDHPWGDRGFAISDPNGITLYIYSEIEPAAEFKQYYKN